VTDNYTHREAYVTIIRQITEARSLVFQAAATGRVEGILQAFTIGAVIVKTAYIQTATWMYRFTTASFMLMSVFTVICSRTEASWSSNHRKNPGCQYSIHGYLGNKILVG